MLKLFYKMLIRKRPARFRDLESDGDEHAYAEWEYKSAKADWEKFYAGRIDLESKRLIDLGCGLGGRSVFYAAFAPSEIIGVEIVEENGSKSRRFADEKGCSATATFEIADAGNLPFDDESFDIAFSENSFEHYPDPEGVLGEAGRVLKPGGLFIINFSQWGAPNGHHLESWGNISWTHLVLSTDEILEITEEAGGRAIGNADDDRARDRIARKLKWDLAHHAECLNRLSIKRFESMIRAGGIWDVLHRRRTAAAWWMFPLKSIPGLNELTAGRLVYILQKIRNH